MNDNMMSVRQLMLLLAEYKEDVRLDFADNYLAGFEHTDERVIKPVWINKAEKDAADEAQKKAEREEYEAANSLPLEQSGLEKRLVRLLTGAGIRTIYELAQNDIFDLLPIRGFGWKSIPMVECELARHGWYPGGHRVEEVNMLPAKRRKSKT